MTERFQRGRHIVTLVTALRRFVRRMLFVIFAIPVRIFKAIWMPSPPAFMQDWQANPPIVPVPSSGRAPSLVPSQFVGQFVGTMMRVTMPSEGIEPTLPRGVVLPAEASKPGYRHPVNIAFGYRPLFDLSPA